MRTYRLQFSSDEKVLSRRLAKAQGSFSERILGIGFQQDPPKHLGVAPVWAWEGSVGSPQPLGWDEYHILVQDPRQWSKVDASTSDCIVIQPRHKNDMQAWIEIFIQIPNSILQTKVYLEFQPWQESHPSGMTVHEVAQFLYQLRHHVPNWKPRRRPGVEMWDSRVPEAFELEAGAWEEKNFSMQEKRPDVSVVIPSFNNKDFVQTAIAHLAGQDLEFSRYEVIVVDDGGTDQTLPYLELFGIPAHLQLRFIYWPRSQTRNRGDKFFRAGLCRNLGVRVSRGNSLVFLDSDMLVPREFLSSVLSNLESADVLQFPRWHIHQNKSRAGVRYESISPKDCYIEEEKYWRPFFETDNWMNIRKFWKYTCTYGLAMRKTDFVEAGRFCRFYISYGFEDTELGYRLAQNQKRFRLVPLKLMHLTSYSTSEYQFSKKTRHLLLRRTAKQFFLNTLDIENFQELRIFMAGENSTWYRLKKALDFRGKSRFFDDTGAIDSAKPEAQKISVENSAHP